MTEPRDDADLEEGRYELARLRFLFPWVAGLVILGGIAASLLGDHYPRVRYAVGAGSALVVLIYGVFFAYWARRVKGLTVGEHRDTSRKVLDVGARDVVRAEEVHQRRRKPVTPRRDKRT